MTSVRPNQHEWLPAYESPPPAACATLRAQSNNVEYGLMCVFAEEDGDVLPNPANTACLPWATDSVTATSVFYSPATVCPTSWTAVATRTAAEGASDWIDGETALDCCPPGFVGGTGGMCDPGLSGTVPVMACGEADAEENEDTVYTAESWPASMSARVTALHLRYQPVDVKSTASATAPRSGGGSPSTGTSSPGPAHGDDGLSVAAKAAIGTVLPLVFLLAALAVFLLRRRRRRTKSVAARSGKMMDGQDTHNNYEEVHQPIIIKSEGMPAATATMCNTRHETPEWNAELDATEAERRRYMAVQSSHFPAETGDETIASSPRAVDEVSELYGMMRVNRKPVAPIELDSTPLTAGLIGNESIEQR